MNVDQKRTFSENQLGNRKILDKSICSVQHENNTTREQHTTTGENKSK